MTDFDRTPRLRNDGCSWASCRSRAWAGFSWPSQVVGDQVVYWEDRDETSDDVARIEPIRIGDLSGPSDVDHEGDPFRWVDVIAPVDEGGWVIVDQDAYGDSKWRMCSVPSLDCHGIGFDTRTVVVAGVIPTR